MSDGRLLPNYRPQRRADLDVVSVGAENVIWDPVRDRVHRLDPIASVLWQFMDGSASIDELAADVVDVWERQLDEATAAVVEMIAQLMHAGLLVDSSETTTPGWPARSVDTYLVDPPTP